MTDPLGNLKDSDRLPRVRSLALLLVTLLIMPALFAVSPSLAQRRNPRRATPSRAAAIRTIDYAHFSHSTAKHKSACVTCHKIPTGNWNKVREFPDVADFPDHEACVACHRRQFFKGASPQICSVCHVKVSPRDEARFAFRNPRSLLQFAIEFPHDKHQDVIALKRRDTELTPRVGFVNAFYVSSPRMRDEPAKTYNNCTICHVKQTTIVPAPPAGWVDLFVPDAATFKSVPTSHASCFNCHWKSQPPVSTACAGCHKLAAPHPPELGITRISMKFRHARDQHVAECTTCHINITKSTTLRGLTPDVPITSCTECHNKEGLRLDVSRELEAIDKQHDFVCTYCHTSNVGIKDPPASHNLIAGRPAIKRSDLR